MPFTERWMPPVTNLEYPPVAAMPYETPTPRCRQAKDDERQRTVTYASRGYGACVERAADPLHCAGINAKSSSDLAHALCALRAV